VAHTHQVIERLGNVLSLLTDIETAQRGYALTGREDYLEPYNAALPMMDQAVTTLRTLTTDNLGQQQQLDSLEPLIAARLEVSLQLSVVS